MNTETILNELKDLRYNIGELIQRERTLVDQLVSQGVTGRLSQDLTAFAA